MQRGQTPQAGSATLWALFFIAPFACPLSHCSTPSHECWPHIVQVATQLAAAEKEAAGLKADAKRAESLAGQCQRLTKELEEGKEGQRLVVLESQKQRTLLERELQAASRDRDQLAQQVTLPPSLKLFVCCKLPDLQQVTLLSLFKR